MAQKPVLGKGLASLLPGAASVSVPPALAGGLQGAPGDEVAGPAHPVLPDTNNKDRHPGISIVSLDDIKTNPYQPRREFDQVTLEELSDSIKANGIIQPLVVRKMSDGFELIAGERRLRASKLAGLKQVPVVIRKSTDRESLELALVENIQRQNLNCIDEALAYQQLALEFHLTQEELARRVGKDRTTVANFIRLLKLPEAIIDDLKRGILTFGHGKALLAVDDNDIRLRARAEIVQKRLSVRDAEALVDALKKGTYKENPGNPATQPGKANAIQQRFDAISRDLARQWGTRVEIKGNEKKGKIVVHFTARGELDRILSAIQDG